MSTIETKKIAAIQPAFNTTKKVGIQLLMPKEWHNLFNNIAENSNDCASNIINYPLELGIIVNDAYSIFKKGLDDTPVGKNPVLADFVGFIEDLRLASVTPGSMHVLQAHIDQYSSPVEKYGALRLITTAGKGKEYHTYRMPKEIKKWCQSLAKSQNVTITHIILDFVMVGIALLYNTESLKDKATSELVGLEPHIRQLANTRITKMKYNDETEVLRLKMAEFTKKELTVKEFAN